MMLRRLLVGCLLSGAVLHGAGAADSISVQPQEPVANVFGGKEFVCHFLIVSKDSSWKGKAAWSFAVAGRIVARRERELTIESRQGADLEVRFAMPEVKAGVVLEGVLSVILADDSAALAVAATEKRLWIFPEDPFADNQAWLKGLNLQLFDPEKKTADRFEKAAIPFNRLAHVDAIGGLQSGVLIVGEGVSFKVYRGLYGLLTEAAARGIPVLCLAPAEGSIRMAGATDTPLPVAQRLGFRRNDVIAELDKRLDAGFWKPEGKVPVMGLELKGEQGAVAGDFNAQGWPWMEMRLAPKGARLVLCGFALIEPWEDNPAPRFLFERILRYVATMNVKTVNHSTVEP